MYERGNATGAGNADGSSSRAQLVCRLLDVTPSRKTPTGLTLIESVAQSRLNTIKECADHRALSRPTRDRLKFI